MEKETKVLGFEKNVFYSGLTSFFTDTSTKMVYSVMPLFLTSMGASKTSISMIEGIAESTASLLKAISGIWSDKIRKNKPFMIFGYGVTALVTPLYALVGAPVHVLWLRFVERVGKGLRAAPRDSLIAHSIRKEEAGKSFGFHKAMDNSGAILGPLTAFAMLYFFPMNYRNIFIVAAIPAVIGVLTIIVLVKDRPAEPHASRKKAELKQLPGKYYFFLVIIILFTLGNSTDALLLVKTQETGVNNALVPLIYMLFNMVSVILAVPIGKLSDRIGREKLIIAGFLVYALVYFLFGSFNDIRVFIPLFMLYGLYGALTDSSQKAIISDIVGKEVKGMGYGIYHAVLGITLFPASLIAGLLYDKINASAPFYFGGTMALLAAVLMVFFTLFYMKKTKKEQAA